MDYVDTFKEKGVLMSRILVTMSRYEMKPRKKTKIKDGKVIDVGVRPSTESMVRSLGQLTVTRIIVKGRRKETHFSNWDDISREVFSNIRAESDFNRLVFA